MVDIEPDPEANVCSAGASLPRPSSIWPNSFKGRPARKPRESPSTDQNRSAAAAFVEKRGHRQHGRRPGDPQQEEGRPAHPGKAVFEASDRVRLAESEIRRIKFKHAIVATGSKTQSLPGIDIRKGGRVMDSDGALDLPDIPERLLVIGGGYVALEMGTVYASLGSRVSLAVRSDTMLRGVDPDLVVPLSRRLKELFENIYFNTRAKSVRESDSRVEVTLEGDAPEANQSFDRVLIAVGRQPNSAELGLDTTKVKLNEKGFIVVDEQQRTSDERIFAIGDVAGAPLLAHKAFREGKVAAEVIKGEPSAFDVQAMPAVVYTDPQIAWCGLTESRARQQKEISQSSVSHGSSRAGRRAWESRMA